MSKSVVVFGATGTVGAYACLYLMEQDYRVTAVGHRKDDNGFFADYGITYYSADISRKEDFEKLPSDGFDAVVSNGVHFQLARGVDLNTCVLVLRVDCRSKEHKSDSQYGQ